MTISKITSAETRLKAQISRKLSQFFNRTNALSLCNAYNCSYNSKSNFVARFGIQYFSTAGNHGPNEKDKLKPNPELPHEDKLSTIERYKSAIGSSLTSFRDLILNPKQVWAMITETAHHYW